MTRRNVLSSCTLAMVLSVVASSARAKDPVALRNNFAAPRIGSLTPPPKEWAMFPQDEPPAAPTQPGQAGQPPVNNVQPSNGTVANNASAANTSSVVSAPNVRSQVPAKELPLLWMALTAVLSLGAVVACGGLILSKDAPEEFVDEDGVPVVSEVQEIRG